MKNIAAEVSGKAFEKQKIIFDSLVVGISSENLIAHQKG
jgi:hypothetical protein